MLNPWANFHDIQHSPLSGNAYWSPSTTGTTIYKTLDSILSENNLMFILLRSYHHSNIQKTCKHLMVQKMFISRKKAFSFVPITWKHLLHSLFCFNARPDTFPLEPTSQDKALTLSDDGGAILAKCRKLEPLLR